MGKGLRWAVLLVTNFDINIKNKLIYLFVCSCLVFFFVPDYDYVIVLQSTNWAVL